MSQPPEVLCHLSSTLTAIFVSRMDWTVCRIQYQVSYNPSMSYPKKLFNLVTMSNLIKPAPLKPNNEN